MNVMIMSGYKTILQSVNFEESRKALNVVGVNTDALGIHYSTNYCSTCDTLPRSINLAHEYTGTF